MTKQILQQINMENDRLCVTEDVDGIIELIDEFESNKEIETLYNIKPIFRYMNDREWMY